MSKYGYVCALRACSRSPKAPPSDPTTVSSRRRGRHGGSAVSGPLDSARLSYMWCVMLRHVAPIVGDVRYMAADWGEEREEVRHTRERAAPLDSGRSELVGHRAPLALPHLTLSVSRLSPWQPRSASSSRQPWTVAAVRARQSLVWSECMSAAAPPLSTAWADRPWPLHSLLPGQWRRQFTSLSVVGAGGVWPSESSIVAAHMPVPYLRPRARLSERDQHTSGGWKFLLKRVRWRVSRIIR